MSIGIATLLRVCDAVGGTHMFFFRTPPGPFIAFPWNARIGRLTYLKLTANMACDKLATKSPGPRLSKRSADIVRWFDGPRGYGYIDTKDGVRVFIHSSARVGRKASLLREGEQAAFSREQAVHGLQAGEVTRLN